MGNPGKGAQGADKCVLPGQKEGGEGAKGMAASAAAIPFHNHPGKELVQPSALTIPLPL